MTKRTLTFILTGLLIVFDLSGCEQSPPENVTQWPLVEKCDLHHEVCTAQMDDASVTLKISPHPIPIAKPLGIEVSLNNLAAQKVELDISGVNMYMGYNRVTLTSTKPDYFVGTSMLAFCTTQKMQWQITLIIHLPEGKQIQIPFHLETSNRS
ncbi:hypothetical protein QCB45_06155 [Thiomicrorhabdus sp. ZW0627]|uniref:hypothetical protein n=1 Tax=Thiomicrorhabdus sp. ZW0627 TaxID=3039774 RepID=UPI002437248B|nr:hypothetical protein [Thiomicrorhabdus sp. ZW0627]MDG6773908.1 hypothetical protein [Thiomicrorhabdus sp. ZW0627]